MTRPDSQRDPHHGDFHHGSAAVAPLPAAPVIAARALAKRFGSVRAVRGLTFEVPDRCVCGLLGPNGAGKTTTIRMLAGLLIPDEGSLVVTGFDLRRDADEARRRVGYLPESAPAHAELRTREYLAYRAALAGLSGARARSAIDRAVTSCALGPVFGRLVGALSKGFRQRVGLAAAILGDPKLVILDEPSVGLDPSQLLEFRRLVRELGQGRTVLLSSHILSEVEAVCDRAILLAGGRLVGAGSIADLQRDGTTTVVVEVRAQSESSVEAALAALRGFDNAARSERLADGWMRVTLQEPDGNDIREGIASRLASLSAATGLVCREMHRRPASLESLFLRATREDAA